MKNSILVEGHTDSRQYQGAQYSNWELSADRANSARKIMEDNGLRPNQVTQVRGFADQQLRLPDHPEDPSNRRVSIIVRYPDNPEPDPGPAMGANEGKEGAEGGGEEKSAKAGEKKPAEVPAQPASAEPAKGQPAKSAEKK
jgi:chemotaxis protein MotB